MKLIRSHQVSVNKLNHGSANCALVTAQVNAAKDSKFTLSQFLPYPQAPVSCLNIPTPLLRTILVNRDRIPNNLRAVVFDGEIHDRLVASYYWLTGSCFYDD